MSSPSSTPSRSITIDRDRPLPEESTMMDGFSPVSSPKIFWNSRRRSENGRKNLDKAMEESGTQKSSLSRKIDDDECKMKEAATEAEEDPYLSERRRALFKPLIPVNDKKRIRPEELLPPPDFESMSYPKGWVVGKKRKLVNVDVVESMRRIAVQEMNRKDREIDGLNEQLVDDGRCMERLQLQLLEERSKRANAEREKVTLESQISMLMEMLNGSEPLDEDDELDDNKEVTLP